MRLCMHTQPYMHRLRLSRTLSERSQLRMEALRTEAEAKKTEGCTFKPKVNPSSVRMVLEKQALQGDECISRYDKLYTDAQRRLEKQQVMWAAFSVILGVMKLSGYC